MGEIKFDEKGEKWIKHYSSSQKILLVGEGDFSFAACLAKAFGSATNIVATSLDRKYDLIEDYSEAKNNLDKLEGLGCTVLHEVNCHTMDKNPLLKEKLFDRIVFNFPHAGLSGYLLEHDNIAIKGHQEVVKGFLRSAREMVTENGEIHITHKTTYPFDRWKIVELAEEVGLRLSDKVRFVLWEYPSYVNKIGEWPKCDKSFPVGECSTFKFVRPSFSSGSGEIITDSINFESLKLV